MISQAYTEDLPSKAMVATIEITTTATLDPEFLNSLLVVFEMSDIGA
jgi:hypothetical protein